MRRFRTSDRVARRVIAEEYRSCDTPLGRAIVRAEAAQWLESVIAGGETLHGWAASREGVREFPGRGRVFSVVAPVAGAEGRERWAVRHYRRGGAMAMHMEDRYLRVGRPRPFRELEASCLARARGIRTPAVVAGATYRDGPYYRCDLVTEVVPDVRTLADLLHEHDGTRGWLVSMARAGALVRRLAEAGVFHVDLNARNVLMADDPDEEPWVVDLDRARILGRPSASAGDRMQVRLTRSIVKIGTPTGERLRDGEIEAALTRRPEAL
jgi:3-deoxy-D-manno-octulosonic acid kinase